MKALLIFAIVVNVASVIINGVLGRVHWWAPVALAGLCLSLYAYRRYEKGK